MKILLVEDEQKVASFIRQGLTEQSFTVDLASDGVMGETMAKSSEYDLVIVDLMLPRKSGFSLCKSIRMYNESVPILILTALDSTDDKVTAFETGADDYLVKPFEFRELLARVKSLLRRNSLQNRPATLDLADLKLDPYLRSVTRAGQTIELTAREYGLLEYLLTNRGRVVSKSEIAERVWETDFDTYSNTIEVYINFLRRKIDKNFTPKLIHTVVGMGYVMKV